MGIEDMTPEEAIIDQAPITLKTAAIYRASPTFDGETFFTYADFCASILEDRNIDIDIAAEKAGFPSGVAFLRHLNIEFDGESDNLILPPVDGAPAAHYIHGRQKEERDRTEKKKRYQQPFVPLVNYKPSAVSVEHRDVNVASGDGGVAPQPLPAPVIHIFDGDADKIMPGMNVKICGGEIFSFPSLPNLDPTIRSEKEILRKAGAKHRKNVRILVEEHKKKSAINEILLPIYQKPQE